MQLETPPHVHMDSCTHTWTHWGVFSVHTQMCSPSFPGTCTHTHAHIPLTLCTYMLGARYMHIHTTNRILPFLACSAS